MTQASPRSCIKQATLADLHAVMRDLSEISAAEVVDATGSWWNALPLARQLMGKGPSDALVWDGETVAIGGHMPVERDPYRRNTWFLCRQAFFDHGVRTTVLARKYLKWLQTRYPGVTFESFTRSRHPYCVRWYSLLGYEFLGDMDGAAHFRLKVVEKRVENVGKSEVAPPDVA